MKGTLIYIAAITFAATSIYWIDRSVRQDSDAPWTLASTAVRVRPEACYECHSDIAQKYAAAPHNRTLIRGDDPQAIAALAGKSVLLEGYQQGFVLRDGKLWGTHSQLSTDRPVDWVFGSGHHAMTPVTMDQDPNGHPRLTQFHASVLANGDLGATPGLGVSVGQSDASPLNASMPPNHGKTSDAADTRRCFGCHVSALPHSDGRVDLSSVLPSIDCNRCHPGAAIHAQSGGSVSPTLDWADLTPLESINRCGECHRRVDEFTPDELGPDVLHLVRFSPVGMAMSPCFSKSQVGDATSGDPDFARFDCVTCHDPHSPARTDAAHYNEKCFLCHSFDDDSGHSPKLQSHRSAEGHFMTSGCTVSKADSSCISCHMPKKESGEGLFFTDHWIRVHH